MPGLKFYVLHVGAKLAAKVVQPSICIQRSLSFVQMLDKLPVNVLTDNNLRFTTYDVTALYPSTDLELGLK
jgi:hypothetical protein